MTQEETKYEKQPDGTYKIDCTGCPAHCCKVGPRLLGGLLPMNEEGYCAHLKDDKCSIYDTRPDVCRSGYMFRKLGMKGSMEDYMKQNVKVCDQLKKERE